MRAATAAGCGTLVSALSAVNGVPELRHDWGFPALGSALPPAIATTFLPWLDRGLGQSNAYPTQYLIGFPLFLFSWLPPAVFVGLLLFATAAAIACFAGGIARSLNARPELEVACALIGVFNPWTYTELVAGHVFMLCAYALLLWLAAELLRPEPRPRALAAACALSITQIEFWLFASAFVVTAVCLMRQWRALAAWAIAGLPIVTGIVLHYQELRATPFLLEWQRAQSVGLIDAVTLRGYFAHYDASFDRIWLVPSLLAVLSGIALIYSIGRRQRAGLALAAGALAIACATGTKWIFGAAYSALVLRFPETGVFRELYDLLAFTAVGWCVMLPALGLKRRSAAFGALALCALLPVAWVAEPPSRWFVPSGQLPHLSFPGDGAHRVALLPALQPMSYNGHGSGLDPDGYVQAGRDIPLNDVLAAFPVSSALFDARDGDMRAIGALGTQALIERRQLRSDTETLRGVYHAIDAKQAPAPRDARIDAAPILAIFNGSAPVVRIGRDVTREGIFFGADADTSKRDGITAAEPSRASADPASAWIDARLAVPRYPFLGSSFSGAYTESKIPFAVPRDARYALVWTDLRMSAQNGAVISGALQAPVWRPLPEVTELECAGHCAVLAFARALAGTTDEGMPAALQAVDFRWRLPWLVQASLPAHQDATLRFAENYDDGWLLLGAQGRHVELDQSLNAWELGPGPAAPVTIVNRSSAVQFALEILCFAAVAALCAVPLKARRHA